MSGAEKFILKPSQPPPITTVGPLGWMRANLFSSPINVVLTLLSVWLFFKAIPPFVQWAFVDATLLGGDRSVCLITLDNGEIADAPGACWTFIKIRLPQILFGLYYAQNPSEMWRPILMFAMVAFLLATLFTPPGIIRRVPRNAFTTLMLPFIVPSFRRKILQGAFLVIVFPFIGYGLIHGEWFGLPVAETDQWGGFMLTFILAAVGIVAAFPMGIILALGRRSNLPFIRAVCIVFIESIRGVPLITLLFMASNMLPLFFPSEVQFDKVARALVAITLFQSAYTAEAIRGGLQAVPKGQFEAADGLGLSYWKKTGFIVLPQALKISIPGIVNTFIELFKDTTLVSIIGMFDLLGISQAAARSLEWKGFDFEAYIFAAMLYFMFCFGMSQYSQSLERKLETEHKKKR